MRRHPHPGFARSLLAACAVLGLSTMGCSRAEQVSAPAPAPAASTRLGKDILRELSSGSLPYEPVPRWHVAPVLRTLIDDGWDVNAPLDAEIKPLRSRVKNWRKVKCYEVRFTSHEWRGRPVRIFGFYAHPASADASSPALLLVHGGGGYGTLDRVVEAAGHGYAALSIDLPGKGPLREEHSRSTGPDMSVKQIFTVKPTVEDNYLYHAILAQMRSISFLCSRPEVDSNRIGLVGVSWGGATGLITTSLDKRVKCFVDMFGSGYLWAGSTWHKYFETLNPREFAAWEDNFDASRYVADIKAPVLGLTGTNDNCYYLNRFMRTMRAIQPTPDLILRPNLDHKIDKEARAGYYKWLAIQLKGTYGNSPPSLRALKITADENGANVYVRPGGEVSVKRVEVCYGEVGDIGWTNRQWKSIACAPDYARSWWSAKVPLPSQITYLFASVQFKDGSVLSTPVHSVGRAVINDRIVPLDIPFMYEGSFLVEAHAFAQMTGARLIETLPGRPVKVRIERGGRQALCEARRMGDLCYIGLRDVCTQLGAIVTFKDGKPIIALASLRS